MTTEDVTRLRADRCANARHHRRAHLVTSCRSRIVEYLWLIPDARGVRRGAPVTWIDARPGNLYAATRGFRKGSSAAAA
jgi:hypothetical protein